MRDTACLQQPTRLWPLAYETCWTFMTLLLSRQKYPSCFVGSDAVQWMIKSGLASDVAGAEALGDLLIDHGVFFHVTRRHMFENRRLFYRFMHDRLED